MPDKLIFHFGPPKTGTSAIQNWCLTNSEFLKRNGILYPSHDVDSNGIGSGNLSEVLHSDRAGEYTLNKTKVSRLKHKCGVAGSMFLSSEVFFRQIFQIYKEFPEALYIGYIRNPIEVIESSYNQSIKRHNNVRKLQLPPEIALSHLNLLSSIAKRIPPSQLVLRPYIRSKFPQENIVGDFLTCLNLDGFILPPRSSINRSYTFIALEVKRWLNQLALSPIINHQVDILLQRYTAGESDYTLIPPDVFPEYKAQAVRVLRNFSVKKNIESAEVMAEYINSYEPPGYLEQNISYLDFKLAIEYIESHNAALYLLLSKQVHLHLDPSHYNRVFVRAFTKRHSAISKCFLISKKVGRTAKSIFERVVNNDQNQK